MSKIKEAHLDPHFYWDHFFHQSAKLWQQLGIMCLFVGQ